MVYTTPNELKGKLLNKYDEVVLLPIEKNAFSFTVQNRYLAGQPRFWDIFYNGPNLKYEIADRIYQFPNKEHKGIFPETAATGDLAMRDLTRMAIFLFIAIEEITQIAQSTGKTFKEASKDADYDAFIKEAITYVPFSTPLLPHFPKIISTPKETIPFLTEEEEDTLIGDALCNEYNNFKNILT